MNISIIVYIVGWIMNFEAVMLLVPFATSLYYHEYPQGLAYLAVLLVEGGLGVLLTHRKPKKTNFYAKEGYIAVGLCWIVLSVFGAFPFVFSGDIPSPINALFETVSGFTTTGASILTKIEEMSHTSLMWRSFTHWVGGMGVLVFVLIILPLSGGSSMYLLRAESPGPSVGKLRPKMRTTALVLYSIYFVMTLLEIMLLLFGGMGGFEALTISFGTAGTGGFAVTSMSIQPYSQYCRIVIAVFMMLFGVNFNIYYLFLLRKFKEAFKSEELRWYLAIMATATLLITGSILSRYRNIGLALSDAFFQVSSIMTTTGYATTDFNLWPEQAKTILVLLMFIGASAGSTGGGIKISRIAILIKSIPRELGYYLHPHSVRKIKFEGKPIDHETSRAISVYIVIYVLIFSISVLILSFDAAGMVTSFTAVAATINNIGPGLELVGPYGGYGFFSPLSKLVLIFDMLAGRLELIPLLLLFCPSVWKDLRTGGLGNLRGRFGGKRKPRAAEADLQNADADVRLQNLQNADADVRLQNLQNADIDAPSDIEGDLQ